MSSLWPSRRGVNPKGYVSPQEKLPLLGSAGSRGISVNAPDLVDIHGIYESADTSDPSAPKATLSSIVTNTTTTTELIIGEQLI